ncbi:Rrf2 family transcriptional regulator [Arthrobacter sp. ISL-48]|uniref:RrF2 family transcriptional regulator n=1 Tax=Arthrobacter sp. ISL-48 TaxID=2819110 RepID=UPI001BECEC70|nr:Rrf2 family transcriptional regulator [Arthrobacter sp. ISL-48]MBT2530759.1 Rrf2 family transcriptional regulator [Arthrobacter sp. ISL-48]
MKMGQGVEWALHSCVNMSWTPVGEAVSSVRLAAFYKLPAAYLNKQLQALVRAGILASVSGPRGGFQLARRADRISVLDVVLAIEGKDDAFRCGGILKDAPDGAMEADYARSCLISQTMRHAEVTWRTELSRQTIAGIAQSIERRFPDAREETVRQLTGVRGRQEARTI